MYKMNKNFDDGVFQFEIEIPGFDADGDIEELLLGLGELVPDYDFPVRKKRPEPKSTLTTNKTAPNPYDKQTKWLEEYMKSVEKRVEEAAKRTAEPVAPVKPTAAPALPEIEKVIYNLPATIVFWKDGTKTIVKCDDDYFDPEKGLAMAYIKKLMGNTGAYYEMFRKHCPGIDPFPMEKATKATKKEAKV